MNSRAHHVLVAVLVSLAVGFVSAVVWGMGPTMSPYEGGDGLTPEASQRDEVTAAETPQAPAPTPDTRNGNAVRPSGPQHAIELEGGPYFAEPFETVQISGTYPTADASTELRVQWQRGKRWVSLPLPTVPDPAGDFTAFVELGGPNLYRLRVVDPQLQVTSNTVMLHIR
jgi:hypothetical protein